MTTVDSTQGRFRALFGTLALGLLLLVLSTLAWVGSSPTDENWFVSPPSPLLLARTVGVPETDAGLPAGVLITHVDDKRVATAEQLRATLRSGPADGITVRYVRPSDLARLEVRLPAGTLRTDDIDELTSAVIVIDVIAGGASDRAGMQRGDIITLINGKTFDGPLAADAILRAGTVGRSIEYVTLRGVEPRTLYVTLAAFGFPLAPLTMTLSGLLIMAGGAFLGLVRPRFPAARLLGSALLLGGSAIALFLLQRAGDSGPFPFRLEVLILAGTFAPALALHSGQFFPTEHPGLVRRRWTRAAGYVLAAISATVLILTRQPGPALVILFFIPLFIVTRLAARKETPLEYRRMNRPIRWALGLTGAGFGVIAAAATAGWLSPLESSVYAGPLLLLPPAGYFYVIGRHKLLDLSFRVGRNVQYALASLGWTSLALLLFLALWMWLPHTSLPLPNIRVTAASLELRNEPLTSEERDRAERSVLMLLGLASGFVVWKLGRWGNTFLAHAFDRGRYDYRRAAEEIGRMMSTRLDRNQLVAGIVERITALMRVKRGGVVLFREDATCCCARAQGFDAGRWTDFCVSRDRELVASLAAYDRAVRLEYLPAETRAGLEREGFRVAVPVRSQKRMLGAIFVGEKRSETEFQTEDLDFLDAVARQASVAVENAFLHEELSEQERLRHELEIARRIQLASLPQNQPAAKGLDVDGRSLPALEVGGDFFDYLEGTDRLGVVIGDVSGKGTSAALYMSKVQGILRSLHGFGLSPRELLLRANRLLCRDLERNSFVTALAVFFIPGERRALVARAGHLPLMRFRPSDGSVGRILPRGIGLGLSAEGRLEDELEELSIGLEAGDVFLLVTDGVTEARNMQREQFGEDRLGEILSATRGLDARAAAEAVMKAVKEFSGEAAQFDDQTVVVVRIS